MRFQEVCQVFFKGSRPTITFAMVTKNEEVLLPQCLESIRGWVDEIIVVDNNSTDSTKEIAKRYNAKIIINQHKDNLSLLRNIYLRAAKCDWIFSLDADERIAKRDIPRIIKLTRNKKVMGYSLIGRLYTAHYGLLYDWFACSGEYPEEERFSRRPGFMHIDKKPPRLFRNVKGLFYEGYQHETIEQSTMRKGEIIKYTNIPIHHFKELNIKGLKSKKAEYKYRFEMERKKNALVFKDHFKYYFRMGRDYLFLKKDYKSAFKYLEKSIEMKPDFVYSYFLLALVCKRRKRYKDAISTLKKALKIKKSYVGAHYLLGLIYDLTGEAKLSEEEFSKALDISPYHPIALNSLGVVLTKQKRVSQAAKCFRKAVEIRPNFKTAQNNLKNIKTLNPRK